MSSSLRRIAPVSVRFSADERAALVARAGAKPLSTYIKLVLFSDAPVVPKNLGRTGGMASGMTRQDRAEIAQILAWLGETQLAAHLAVLSHAAESGSLIMDAPVVGAVLQACDDIEAMRIVLMNALGKRDVSHDPGLEVPVFLQSPSGD